MIRFLLISIAFIFVSINNTAAQCTTLGQNPETAFPVCGTTSFQQSTVPICSSNNLYVPGCASTPQTNYENKNPFWYKFTCYGAGTLGFVITPNTGSDDYDWQLYDITGHNPTDIYTINSLVVTGNWSATPGNTGASAAGVNFIQCASSPTENKPNFAAMPNLVLGHEYLLLISHYTNSQSGYSLSFGGGTANITDPKLPKLESSNAKCDGTVVTIKLNKKMKCSSISTGEFSLVPALATVTGISGIGCSLGFDMDQLTLTLSNPLPAGNYLLKIKNGSDGNTFKDYCDRTIPEGDSVELTIFPVFPTPLDSITKPGCAPNTLELVFSKPIRCSSIDPGGTDFIVFGGPYPVTVTGASGDCVNGLTSKIFVQLNAPLQRAGQFKIKLVVGLDGTTIIDECGQQTPLGPPLTFNIKDTVSADFTQSIFLGCELDTISYFHDGRNGVNSWQWNFDNLQTSNLQNPKITYNVFGIRETELIVSNGVCSDTASKSILLNNTLKAKFEATLLVCPNDQAKFKDQSIGNKIVNWSWDFANGNTSNLQNPPPQNYIPGTANYYALVRLIVQDSIGCLDTARININILNNCYIAVPTAFSPNGDGLNDYLYPLNAYKTTGLSFSVYNRFGQRIFYTRDWTNKWDGTYKGQGADPGTYVWVLTYTSTDLNKRIEQKGTTVLIR